MGTQQSPRDIGVFASSATSVTQTSSDYKNLDGFVGIKVVLDTTVASAGSVVLTIQGKDLLSGKYYTILAGAAVTTVTTNVYTVYPGAPGTANVSISDCLPGVWRITCSGNASPQTYSVGATLLN